MTTPKDDKGVLDQVRALLGMGGDDPPPDNPPKDPPPKVDPPPQDPPRQDPPQPTIDVDAIKADFAKQLADQNAAHTAELEKRDQAMLQLAQRLENKPDPAAEDDKMPGLFDTKALEARLEKELADPASPRYWTWTNPNRDPNQQIEGVTMLRRMR